MTDNSKSKENNWLVNFRMFLDETDTRLLVFAPPILGFGIIIICSLIVTYFPEFSMPLPLAYMGLGILFLFVSSSGFAEIYKKEMPGPMGGVAKGKIAVISGILLILLFAIPGFVALIYGFIGITK